MNQVIRNVVPGPTKNTVFSYADKGYSDVGLRNDLSSCLAAFPDDHISKLATGPIIFPNSIIEGCRYL